MGRKSGARFDHVIIVDEQQAVSGVLRIVVRAETEAVMGIQPADTGMKTFVVTSNVDDRLRPVAWLRFSHGGTPFSGRDARMGRRG